MFDKLRDKSAQLLPVALIAAGLGTAACGPAKKLPVVPIERCFDAPQPKHVYDPKNYAGKQPTIELHFDTAKQMMREAPIVNQAVLDMLVRANVSIDNGDRSVSGFVTTDPDGNLAIITAAHVLSKDDLNSLKITDSTGRQVGAADACYLYEKDGAFSPVVHDPNTGVADYDIAIIKPSGPIGGTPLKLAAKPPQRGTWLEFVNNQAGLHPKKSCRLPWHGSRPDCRRRKRTDRP